MRRIYYAKLDARYETTQCFIEVRFLDIAYIKNNFIFVIETYHKKSGKVTYRFGSAAQVRQILNSYRTLKPVRFRL